MPELEDVKSEENEDDGKRKPFQGHLEDERFVLIAAMIVSILKKPASERSARMIGVAFIKGALERKAGVV